MALWKNIQESSNYEISDSGIIRNAKTRQILKQRSCKGYARVALYKNGSRSDKMVHRLVAEAFLEKPDGYNEINHINGCKTDNRVKNLEWCTRSENMKHAFRTGLKEPSGPVGSRKIRVVETGKIYNSSYECARDINGDQGHVIHCLSGVRKTHKGCHFEYI